MTAQTHRSDPAILDRRSLATDHRRLAALLRPGMQVLDVGCGTGAITAGIAPAVRPGGAALGIDRDRVLIERGRAQHAGVPGLTLEVGDVLALDRPERFDVVTAARVLQWIADPAAALARMARATRPGGRVVVLDFDHEALRWEPAPPRSVACFYAAFLAWRAASRFDNGIARRLPDLFRAAGLGDVVATPQDEIARRGEPGFEAALAIWARVIEGIGPDVCRAGRLSDTVCDEARRDYARWRAEDAALQHMVLAAVEGRVAG